MTDLVLIISSILENHRGKDNAIKSYALLYQINERIWPEKIDDRAMRMVIEKDLPHIASCTRPGGYFLPANIAEVNRMVQCLDSYIGSLSHRRKAVLDKYPDAGQGKLFGEERP